MKAIQLIGKDSPPVVSDLPVPGVNAGNKLIRVSHAALNHRDLWIVKGMYAKINYPVVPGSDLCGFIGDRRVVVNPGFYWGENERVQSKNFQILGLPDQGSFAEYVSVPEEYVYDVPTHLNDAEAAALPLAGITAYRALFTKCQPIKGENILITGIGGGVALQIMQFAITFGLNVYVSSSDDSKIQKAISYGAKGGVNYLKEDWDQELNSISGGVHMIIDSAGGSSFAKLLNVCLPAARISLYGGTQGVISDLSPQKLYWKQLSIHGTTMGTQSEFKAMIDFVAHRKIVPIVDSVFELDDVVDAFRRMDRKEQFGKIVLKMSE
jgi:NADPH:quinone reductase-like Zn-dependent oxidoreductase